MLPSTPRSTARPYSKQGFTLIELLTVISLLVALAGITFGITRGVRSAQGRAKAKAELATLSQAIELYKGRYGDYPWHQSGGCLLYTSPSPRDRTRSRMPSSA